MYAPVGMSLSRAILTIHIITKLPESGVLCDNITEFEVAEDHLSPQGEGDLLPPQTK